MKIRLMKKMSLLLVVLISLQNTSAFAQENMIKITPTTQKFIGDVSKLDRSKFFVLHAAGEDEEFKKLFKDYNVTPFGRRFYGPAVVAKQKTGEFGVFPSKKLNRPANPNTIIKQFVVTDHPKNIYKEGVDKEAFADWAVRYFKNTKPYYRPTWYEPMNEPFVHAKDFYDEKDWDPVAEARVKKEMSEMFNVIATKMKADASLDDIKVIGFGSAWPSFELKDFQNWEDNMKMFLDIAGENLDAVSYHLYDGINQAGQDNKRSGSNNEAIMDLIENYAYARWGKVKEHAITEYGGIERKEYSDIRNVQSIRSQNAMIFGLMDREDRLGISIPFNEGKAQWHINKANKFLPYKAVLWKPVNMGVPKNEIKGWEYTDRIYFFDLWKEVKGKRVAISTSNPDVQTQAFVDGDKLYVALNNLDDNTQKVKINFETLGAEIKALHKKSFTVYKDKAPVFVNKAIDKSTSDLEVKFGETVVLTYTFKQTVKFDRQVIQMRFFSKNYLEPINANEAIDFEFKKVNGKFESASLSMSIGRKHDKSKKPIVIVNGSQVKVPDNWKGYDQKNRKDFFGMIEIPVPAKLLKKNTKVTVTFPDKTGHVSTLILNTIAVK